MSTDDTPSASPPPGFASPPPPQWPGSAPFHHPAWGPHSGCPPQSWGGYPPYYHGPGVAPGFPPFAGYQQGHHAETKDDGFSLSGLVADVLGGNVSSSTIGKLVGSTKKEFWVGAAIGVGVVLLLTNDHVKGLVSGLFAGEPAPKPASEPVSDQKPAVSS